MHSLTVDPVYGIELFHETLGDYMEVTIYRNDAGVLVHVEQFSERLVLDVAEMVALAKLMLRAADDITCTCEWDDACPQHQEPPAVQ